MSRITVIGRGAWGSKLQGILAGEGLLADWPVLARRAPNEELDLFKMRVRDVFQNCGGDVIWLAIPPENQALMFELAVDAGRHVVVEKPWLVSPTTTQALVHRAKLSGLATAVSYIYCFLDKITEQSVRWPQAISMEGHFSIASENRLRLGSFENLGSHLLAIRRYVCPYAKVLNLETGYNSENARNVTFHYDGASEFVNFSYNKEPIVQRLAVSFLSRVDHGSTFIFDLDFATSVFKEIENFKSVRKINFL